MNTVVLNLNAGNIYTFKIMSESQVGKSIWSSNKFMFLIVDIPTPPLNLLALSFDDSYVTFRW